MTEGTGTSVEAVSEEVARRLRAVGRVVSPDEIGDLWIFPPLEDVEHSAEFLLFTRRLEEGQLRLYSARLLRVAAGHGPSGHGAHPSGNGHGAAAAANGNGSTAAANGDGSAGSTDGDGLHQEITEHGSVPADRVHALVVRFRRRLGDDGEPRHVVIDGRAERWHELLPSDLAPSRRNGHGPVEASEGGS